MEGICTSGHKHDWEHIVVWVQEGIPKYVAASAHGGYDVRKFEDIMTDGDRPKIVYHKDKHKTHCFRHAKAQDDDVENHKGEWFQGALIGYTGWPDNGLRLKAFTRDWGKAHVAVTDEAFGENLELAKGNFDIGLDTSNIDPNYPTPSCAGSFAQ